MKEKKIKRFVIVMILIIAILFVSSAFFVFNLDIFEYKMTYHYNGVESEIIFVSNDTSINVSYSNFESLLSYLNNSSVPISGSETNIVGFTDEKFNDGGKIIGWIEIKEGSICVHSEYKRYETIRVKTNEPYIEKTEKYFEHDKEILSEYNSRIISAIEDVYGVKIYSENYLRMDKIMTV